MKGTGPPPHEPIRTEGSEAAAPRLAATIVLVRRGGRHKSRGLEVLLVRRSLEARFMPGVWVFPGGAVDKEEGTDEAAHRAAAIRELGEEAGIEIPDPEILVPWTRWITPVEVAIRFDTRFYLAETPGHQEPTPDGEEAIDARWWDPARALEAHSAGEIDLVFPTIKHLEALTGFDDAREAVDAARSNRVVPVQPRVLREGESWRVVLPGEPGYEDAAPA